MRRWRWLALALLAAGVFAALAQGATQSQDQPESTATEQEDSAAAEKAQEDPALEALKQEAADNVDGKLVQEMVDSIFSFGELGFQEVETSRYITNILRENGFSVQTGIAGVPTAWMATWGSGKPVIALGSDIDGIPKSSQKPGVAFRDPLIPDAPGHGEGHNSGQAVNIAAALSVKKLMERENIKGTLKIWPGVAEELLGTKAYYVREGFFRDVDVTLFSHVDTGLSTSWGEASGNGLISLEYAFQGKPAHGAGDPWNGRSALDAVELMNQGMNYRREHLRVNQRMHYVITEGGEQPNVVPDHAKVWYFLREQDYDHIKDLWRVGNQVAQGAAKMTETQLESITVLGSAWPQHMNKPVAEAAAANMEAVGMPEWSEDDQRFAKAIQAEYGAAQNGLKTEVDGLDGPIPEEYKKGGGSDDIGDISWNVPTITLRYPANVGGTPGHSWWRAIAMATPVAHKGSTTGAKVQARTLIDLVKKPELVRDAWTYFRDVQTKDVKYRPLIRRGDKPAVHLNKEKMERFRPQMREFYYDPSAYDTYLEQLGIEYPTTR
ncbi:MAG TPA: amidohydrolase [Solirubrobacteraceae bacterium]|nr:amidohydrolase [Solirubrobacteraceae bacterium]